MQKKDHVRKVLDMLDGELPQLGVNVKDNRNCLSKMFEKECTTTTSMRSKGKKVGFSNHDERSIESRIRKLKKSKVTIKKRISTIKKTRTTFGGENLHKIEHKVIFLKR
jgi:recombinational DNA repair ATPase RecF